MKYTEHQKFAHEGLTKALLHTLEMAMEGDEKNEKYGWYNGLLFTVENLARTAYHTGAVRQILKGASR